MLNQSKSNKVWVSDLNRSASRPFSVDGPIRFYDTTLRDGEQTVGVVLQPDQKVSLARHLDSLGVSRIEAGFARVSPEDADAIRRIRDDGLKAEIWGFARAARPDVDEVIRLGMKFTVIEIPTSAIKLNNDFGLATACAIAAVRAGANWIQGTINGMGERAGNADIAEVALALECLYNVPAALDLTRIRQVSKAVREAGKYELEPWRPLVGENLFVRESGAVASQFHMPETIEPYSAELVGAQRQIVLGKKSGLDSITLKAQELGLDVPEAKRATVLNAVKVKGAAAGRLVTDSEFRQIVMETTRQG